MSPSYSNTTAPVLDGRGMTDQRSYDVRDLADDEPPAGATLSGHAVGGHTMDGGPLAGALVEHEPAVATFTAVDMEPSAADLWPWTWQLGPAGNRSPVFLVAKRLIDVVGAAVLVVLLSPMMLVTWAILMITTKGNPIFAQERIGFLGRPFRMYKFRTMELGAVAKQQFVQNDKDGPIFKSFHDPRITRVGRVLRSFSIDETPQLINVLLGQMSLVGPRPALANEVRQYEPWQRQRLSVKPGLTCLWQVSGRSEIGFEEWMRMDVWYMEHQSFWTDLKLIALTPYCVLSRRGAY
jgi:lipopolysaccharide/colanic/teichoic acid biosynthesis glycosyltransferase